MRPTESNSPAPQPLLGCCFLFLVPAVYSYSVLTHEAIIDSTWDSAIKPLLLKRFPAATAEELTQAHGFAYGGCIIQDLGYYPFGSKFFSNLTHYVRSGDFILNLIRESQDLNEYAFALGALSHYAADNNGHSLAVNRAVPLFYPELGRKFGKLVTYADDPLAHTKTEFAFDVFQAAKGRYASAAYKDFIGFQVAKPLLERAFLDTYGMTAGKSIPGCRSHHRIVSPRGRVGSSGSYQSRLATQETGNQERRSQRYAQDVSLQSIPFQLRKNWGSTYKKPGIRSKILATVFRVVPRAGPFRPLSFKRLTPEIEKMYMASFNATIERYRELLSEQNAGRLNLPNDNLDVGTSTAAGKYTLADAAYSTLLHKLQGHYTEMPPELRSDILAFYGGSGLANSTKTSADDSARVVKELDQLRAVDLDLARNGAAEVRAGGTEVSAGVGGRSPMSDSTWSSRLARHPAGCCWRPCWRRFPRPPARSRAMKH
jgi:hypothetical protein